MLSRRLQFLPPRSVGVSIFEDPADGIARKRERHREKGLPISPAVCRICWLGVMIRVLSSVWTATRDGCNRQAAALNCRDHSESERASNARGVTR